MLKTLLLPLLLVLPAVSCGGEEAAPAAASETATADVATTTLEPAVRELRCGCKIPGIDHCGNYVREGDEWMKISNFAEHNLTNMEWCSVPKDQKVEGTVSGERSGDMLKLTSIEVAAK